jgi:AcrR family transcriptional regulator
MAEISIRGVQHREPLTRERVIRVAVSVADDAGIASLTMRKLAERLGVEAMSLYHHVANKNEIFDGMVDAVFSEVELPSSENGWREAMHIRAGALRETLLRHPWALRLVESRANPGPSTLRHHDHVIGCLRGGGFSIAAAAHAFSLLDSYIYGFVLQELNLPFRTDEEFEAVVEGIIQQMPVNAYPHFMEMVVAHALKPGYSYAAEFEFGLDLVLDALERLTADEHTGS